MNEAGRQAIKQAISNARDNLYRYYLQQKADPNWQSRNGEPIELIIRDLERQISELKDNLG